MEVFFEVLKKIYDNFDREYFDVRLNSCGECFTCCTSEMRYPPLSKLEADFIDEFLKQHKAKPDIDVFKRYMTYRDTPLCSYFEKNKGCTIYPVRPMYCKLFGLFRFKGNVPLPGACVFKKKALRVTPHNMYKIIKYLPEFYELKCKYDLFKSGNDKERLEALIRLAREYIKQDREEESYLYLKEGEKLAPEDVRVNFYLGVIYRYKNNIEKAIYHTEKAIDLGGVKYFPEIYSSLGFIYLDMVDMQFNVLLDIKRNELLNKAYEVLNKSREFEENMVNSYLGLAFVANSRCDKERAIELFEKVLSIEPGNTIALKMLEII